MSNSERANQWQSRINQWQESGLSGVKFCKQSELDLAQFYYWKNKLLSNTRNIAVDKKRPTRFASGLRCKQLTRMSLFSHSTF
jgi:hypothetical protein